MPQSKIKHTNPDKNYRRVLAASTLDGDKVRNSSGDTLGKLDQIMIDIPSGKIAYAVLTFGGVLGMGNKLFAVPWNALTVDEDEKCLILDVDKKTLENAPGFDKDNWPDMSDTNWGTEVNRYYGTDPYWQETETKTLQGGSGR
jgi:sporulation protein YlmC with PRC-barrel domain